MPKPKNILFVYPQIPSNTFWSFKYALGFVGKKSAMPPLPLITLAGLFPDTYNLRLIDMNIEPLQENDIRWADAVFVTAMIVQKKSFEAIVARCNQSGTPVVAGGPFPTSSYLSIRGVDHFVLGEVEDTLGVFLRDLDDGNARHVYPPPPRPDMAVSPTPRFDLLEMNSYSSMAIQYSRGCPFKCEFCDIWTAYGNKPRLKSAHQITSELDSLYQAGWRGPVFIVDDNFIGNKGRLKKELLPALLEWQRAHRNVYRFFTEASINLANDAALLDAMCAAGFNEVFIGIETPSAKGLKETGKTQNLKIDLREAVKIIQQHGIEVMAGFILGFDSDTEEIFDRQVAFIQQTGIPQAMVGLLNAMPGTELYKRLHQEGRIRCESVGNNTHQGTNIVTRMDPDKLQKGYQRVLESIYDSNLKNYFERCNTLLDNMGPSTYLTRDITIKDIAILLRSLCRQPFTIYGYWYLRFVFRNVLKHRRFFAEVIRLAIIGHHFNTITRETRKIESITTILDRSLRDLNQQLQKHQAVFRSNSKETLQNVIALWNQRKQTLADIHKKIDNIHVDFRDDINHKYADVAARMRGLFQAFADDLKPMGIQV